MFHNKYYGRSLSESGFRDELRLFLHNGVRLRTELLTAIIEMLEQLCLVIQTHHSYRFFSSSLLIMYDGAEENGRGIEDSKYITQETGHGSLPTLQQNGHDIRGKTNGFLKSATNGDTSHAYCMPSKVQRSLVQELRELVDIRMIDFCSWSTQ